MLVISNKASEEFKKFLEASKIEYILTKDNPRLDKRIADHPDLSLFVLDDKNIAVAEDLYPYYRQYFPNKNIIKASNLEKSYPKDALYNIVRFKNYYIHNDFTEKNIKKYFEKLDIKHLFVKQGYSRCSTIVLRESLLTSDYGIYKALKDKIDIRLLDRDEISLDGFSYGFIGGTCGLYENKLIFTGDITRHKSFSIIKKASDEEGLEIIYPKENLVDLGSLIDIS